VTIDQAVARVQFSYPQIYALDLLARASRPAPSQKGR